MHITYVPYIVVRSDVHLGHAFAFAIVAIATNGPRTHCMANFSRNKIREFTTRTNFFDFLLPFLLAVRRCDVAFCSQNSLIFFYVDFFFVDAIRITRDARNHLDINCIRGAFSSLVSVARHRNLLSLRVRRWASMEWQNKTNISADTRIKCGRMSLLVTWHHNYVFRKKMTSNKMSEWV